MDNQNNTNLNEFEPVGITIALLATASILAFQLVILFTMFCTMKKMYKYDSKLSRSLNKIIKDGNRWRVHIIPDDSPNALCMIKNVAFISKGLLKMLTPDEAMAVLLHEIGHLKSKDLWADLIGKNTILAIMLSIIGAIGGTGFVLPGIFIYYIFGISDLVDVFFARTLGRAGENRSDSFAVKYGYGKAMASALSKLEKWVTHKTRKIYCGTACKAMNKIDEIIDEHPPLKDRVESILKQTIVWEKTQKQSFVQNRNMFSKLIGIKKPVKQ